MQLQLTSLAGPLPAVLLGEERTAGTTALVRDQMIDDLCRIMNRADPELLILDSSLVANRLDEDFSGTLRSFCALPDQPLRESLPIDSASHTVRLRSGTFNGHLYVSMVSVVPWNTRCRSGDDGPNPLASHRTRGSRADARADAVFGGDPHASDDSHGTNGGVANQRTVEHRHPLLDHPRLGRPRGDRVDQAEGHVDCGTHRYPRRFHSLRKSHQWGLRTIRWHGFGRVAPCSTPTGMRPT